MTFQYFLPAPELQPYIDKYWLLRECLPEAEVVTVLPAGWHGALLQPEGRFPFAELWCAGEKRGIYLIGPEVSVSVEFLLLMVLLVSAVFRKQVYKTYLAGLGSFVVAMTMVIYFSEINPAILEGLLEIICG